ncbi:MAG: 16S rRNA (uracil(1498)-N(3))-methyltransferase [Desulfococcaceae bacterium]
MIRRFPVEEIKPVQTEIRLSDPDVRHLKHVLRLKPGDIIRVFDGKGKEYDARISDTDAEEVRAVLIREAESSIESRVESPVHITIAQGFLKEKKMDDLLRPMTELGINRWIPFIAQRSVARPDRKRMEGRKDRWEKIAIESLKQCRRNIVPEITDTVSFSEMLNMGGDSDLRLIFWEGTADPEYAANSFVFEKRREYQRIFAVIGPEGGFSPEEIDQAVKAGFQTAGLGPRILRAETAALAVCTLLQHCFGDLSI